MMANTPSGVTAVKLKVAHADGAKLFKGAHISETKVKLSMVIQGAAVQ